MCWSSCRVIAKSICDFVVGTRTIQTVDHGSATAGDRERLPAF
jgi:hypothetical protein